jgi:hypothetical protein
MQTDNRTPDVESSLFDSTKDWREAEIGIKKKKTWNNTYVQNRSINLLEPSSCCGFLNRDKICR